MDPAKTKEYYRRYMRGYYQKHKDYWRRYYLDRKAITRGRRGSYRQRRDYLAKIDAAWSQTHVRSNPLTRILKRLSITSTSHLESEVETSPSREEGVEKNGTRPMSLPRDVLLEILKKEEFLNIQFPTDMSGFSREPTMLQTLALKDGKRCIIEVSTTPFKVFTKKRREYLKVFLNFFEARYFLCFVKPDLSRYHLLELDPLNIRSIALGLKAIAAMKSLETLSG